MYFSCILLISFLFMKDQKEVARGPKSILEKCKIHFPKKKLFCVPIKIINNTKDDFMNITIEHRTNDKQWDEPSIVCIPLLKPGQSFIIENWPFGKDSPSKASNVLFNFIPFVGWAIPAIRGWGKDYWSFYCTTSRMNSVLETDSWAERWYANIFESDIENGASITFNWNFQRSLYWVSIYRLSNGQSTHYLDAKNNPNPFEKHKSLFEGEQP